MELAWGPPVPRDPSHRRSSGAPGRADELAALRRAYRDACEGALRLLLLDGSASDARRVVAAWTAEHRAGLALSVDVRRPGALERLVEAALAGLGPIRRARHPATRWLARPRAAGRGVTDLLVEAEHRLRLEDSMISLLGELGASNPAVVVLEGMERPEHTMLDLVARLAASLGAAELPRVLVVAVTDRPPGARLAELARGAAARTLALRPLDRDGMRALLSDSEVVDALLALTGGHPTQIERLLRGEALATEEGADPTVRAALEVLALIDAPVGDVLLEAMLGAGPGDVVGPALDEAALARAGAVRGEGTWLLPPTLRERLRASVPRPRAEAIHARASEVLAPAHPAEATRQALAAGRLERAGELALRGAEALSERHAAVDAADLLSEVATAYEARARALPHPLRARLAELAWIAGAHEDAIAHARVLCEERPDDADDALRLGTLLTFGGHHAEAAERLEHAWALDRRPHVGAALAEARYRAGDLDGAARLADAITEEVTPDVGSPSAGCALAGSALEAANTRAKVELARGELDSAEARLGRVLADAEVGSCPRPACQALNNLAIIAMSRGELPLARRRLERALELAEAHGAVFHRGIAHKNLAVVAQLEGGWADALHHAERALRLLAGLADPSLRARLAFNTADLHRSLGDPYRALRLVAHAREQAGDALEPTVHAEGLRVEAAIAFELGRLEQARRAWTDALGGAARARGATHRAAAIEAHIGLAGVEIELGRADAARAHLEAVPRASTSVRKFDPGYRRAIGSEVARRATKEWHRHFEESAASTEGEPLGARPAARVARLRARLADGQEAVSSARLAIAAARETNDPLLVQEARLELARALAGAGLLERARAEVAAMRELERELAERVPERLRELFAERSLARALAELERGLRPLGERPSERSAPTLERAMVGDSRAMQELRRVIARVGASGATALVTGESGSGKELAAAALHAASRRRDAPFIRVNCAALVEELLSSELFGHERGAFTGADRQRKGRFELADGGTLLLDEIGDISPRMQAALLRVLQEGTLERVGGTETLSVDVRVLAATHRDLAQLVAEGRFREDLYYRLSGITVRVPSLRERPSDVPALARHLLETMAEETGDKALAPDALAHLARQRWPGNVRELANALRRVAVLSPATLLTAADFAELGGPSSAPAADPAPPASLAELAYERMRGGEGSIYDLRKRLERELVERALDDAGGNISHAAELLGMKRPRLSKLVNEWGLKT